MIDLQHEYKITSFISYNMITDYPLLSTQQQSSYR